MISLVAILSAGCAVGPDYRTPVTERSSAWQAPLPHGGDVQAMTGWWQRFDDPLVAELIAAAERDSPSLDKAWANIQKARFNLQSVKSSAVPSLSASGSATRSNQLTSLTTYSYVAGNSHSGELDASWELDLFGKVKRNAEAAQARIAEQVANWHDARVSLAADVADTYVQYQGCRMLADAYSRELKSEQVTDAATNLSYQAGFSAQSDAVLAHASVASTTSTLTEQRGDCDILVKSLVYLTGLSEPLLRQKLDASQIQITQPAAFEVASIPANIIRQRPDVAALERELAATSAEIGAAKADLYPSLSLSGSIGISASSVSSSMTTWSFGPSLSIPLFDAGKRRAAVSTSQASYDVALASYRDGVRTAVKEVEQALVYLDSANQREQSAKTAADNYRQYFLATEASWKAGMSSLLDLEDARRSALSTEVTWISLQRDRVEYWISLYKKLGGGWQETAPALSPAELARN